MSRPNIFFYKLYYCEYKKYSFPQKQNGAKDRVLDTILDDRRGSPQFPSPPNGGRRENIDPEDGIDEIDFAEFFIEKMMLGSQQNNLPANQKMVVKVSSSLFISLIS